jgi:hypothetical protein
LRPWTTERTIPQANSKEALSRVAAVLQPPFLSTFDPLTGSEGSIDPLGLAATYERLADRMLPGITVRMGRPRFLTALAVGAHVCAEHEPETVAKDNVTPPYLVFEWWVVEAFVRASDELAESGRIPGIQKVQACYRNSRPVSAPAYLKTASVFGFTGIFRRLARHTQILTNDGLLDEAGYRLLEVWEREQGLEGFLRGREGPGATLRENLRKAVRDGLDSGHTSHRPGHFWSAIAQHLDPARPGRRERAVLLELIDTRAGQSEAVKFITASLRARGAPLEFADEAAHLRSLRSSAPDSLRSVLIAIDKYESLCRPLTDAFDWMRFLASQEPSRGMTAEDFVARAPAARLCTRIAKAVESVSENELVAETWPERGQVLTLLREAGMPAKLVPTVLAHHRETQTRKPPDGKRLWLEEDTRGRLLIRASYRLDDEPEPASDYLHEYRLPTLSRFLKDLGALR